jgi:hypothetical protein
MRVVKALAVLLFGAILGFVMAFLATVCIEPHSDGAPGDGILFLMLLLFFCLSR